MTRAPNHNPDPELMKHLDRNRPKSDNLPNEGETSVGLPQAQPDGSIVQQVVNFRIPQGQVAVMCDQYAEKVHNKLVEAIQKDFDILHPGTLLAVGFLQDTIKRKKRESLGID
jgi:hypothetical protein